MLTFPASVDFSRSWTHLPDGRQRGLPRKTSLWNSSPIRQKDGGRKKRESRRTSVPLKKHDTEIHREHDSMRMHASSDEIHREKHLCGTHTRTIVVSVYLCAPLQRITRRSTENPSPSPSTDARTRYAEGNVLSLKERSADAPACDGHPIPDFAGTNPFIDLLRGKFEVLELLSPFRL